LLAAPAFANSAARAELAVPWRDAATVAPPAPPFAAPWLAYNTSVVANTGSPVAMALGDLDGDGDLDVVTARGYTGGGGFVFLRNEGNGAFGQPVNVAGATRSAGIAVADLNGDGKADVVVSDGDGLAIGNSMSVYLGNGNGTFGAPKTYPTGGLATAVTAANLDGDNALDLAVADYASDLVVVLPGNGNGTFGSATTYGVGTDPWSVVSGSFGGPSGAGADLAVGNYGSANVSILLNTTPSATSCTITGTSGNDVLSGTSGRDVSCGLGGADTLKGVEGADEIRGGPGQDILQGNLGKDAVIGGGGADRLYGGEGNDALDSKDGVIGNDRLDGGPGTDTKVTDAKEASIVDFP